MPPAPGYPATRAPRSSDRSHYPIYRCDLPLSGDFNLLLVVKFAKADDLAPNTERYEAFMKKWGEVNAKASTERAQRDYPAMRTITGE